MASLLKIPQYLHPDSPNAEFPQVSLLENVLYSQPALLHCPCKIILLILSRSGKSVW